MNAGARSPEELETLFEDALMIGDSQAVADLFEEGAVLIRGDGESASGRQNIVRLALTASEGEHTYVAEPLDVRQSRGIALIVAERSINVVRRNSDGHWRYVIVRLSFEPERERGTNDIEYDPGTNRTAESRCQ